MKKFFYISMLALLIIPALSFTNLTGIPENDSKIEVVFNRKLDFNDIVKIKLDLSQKGIIINFKQLEFDEQGKLNGIDFFVDCKDGFSGGAKASGKELGNERPFGFVRDYSENADSPFGTGYLK